MGYGYGRTTYHGKNARDRITGKPARRTFSNTMVAHVWAQRTQDFGQSNNGNFYFEGDSLYSYGSHYLAGFLLDTGEREPVALINAEHPSVTTAGHLSDARGAVRHLTSFAVPELTELREALPTLNNYKGSGRKLRKSGEAWSRNFSVTGSYESANAAGDGSAARALADVRKWLGSFEITEDSEVTSKRGDYTWTRDGNAKGVAVIAKAAGITSAEVRKIQAMRRRKLADAKEAERKYQEARTLGEALIFADMTDSEFAERFPSDGRKIWDSEVEAVKDKWRRESKPWELKQAEEFRAKLHRLAKAAKAESLKAKPADRRKRYAEAAAKLAERRKVYAAHLAGRNGRILKGWRAEAAKILAAWRRNPGKLKWQGEAGTSINIGFYSERTKARVRRIETANYYAANAEAARKWLADREGARPALESLEPDSPERAEIAALEAAEVAEIESAFVAWQSGQSAERPKAEPFLSGYLSEKFPEAWTLLRNAERLEAERLAFEKEAENRRAWLAGESSYWRGSDESGGALMRIRGDMLQTSQGAEVPLAHAIKAFRFVKLCRARGESWHRNGKTIRVGHFQIDSIDAAGNFTAGCHKFNWPEVERIAALAGVLESEPSAEAVEAKEGVES